MTRPDGHHPDLSPIAEGLWKGVKAAVEWDAPDAIYPTIKRLCELRAKQHPKGSDAAQRWIALAKR
jgi:hypothetical protein